MLSLTYSYMFSNKIEPKTNINKTFLTKLLCKF